jgi:hypothetical protein
MHSTSDQFQSPVSIKRKKRIVGKKKRKKKTARICRSFSSNSILLHLSRAKMWKSKSRFSPKRPFHISYELLTKTGGKKENSYKMKKTIKNKKKKKRSERYTRDNCCTSSCTICIVHCISKETLLKVSTVGLQPITNLRRSTKMQKIR